MLIETGNSNTVPNLVINKYSGQVTSIKKSKSDYTTAGALNTISRQRTLTLELTEFFNSKNVAWSMDINNRKLEEVGYNMIFKNDLLFSLDMIIDFKYSVIYWGENIHMNMAN